MPIKEYQRRYRQSSLGKATANAWQKHYRKTHKEKLAKAHLILKTAVLLHYGNRKCACVVCGFNDIRALSIDHINGGGGDHRKEIRTTTLYQWLKSHNYPKGYQTLCMNCQFIKAIENKERQRNKPPGG